MFRSPHQRNAFTLVELLVVMVIAGIISSMVAIALSGASRQAQETRAEAMMDRLNLLVLQIYEEESERRVSVPTAGVGSAEQRGLTTLMWRRDWLRCAMPDRREDVQQQPTAVSFIAGAIPPILSDGGASNSTGMRGQQLTQYRQRIVRTVNAATGSTYPETTAGFNDLITADAWTSEHQSAECLYQILATHMVNGVPAIDSLRTRDTGDTDDDGMPEVLDPWGVPVGFMRWPTGYYMTPAWNNPPSCPVTSSNRADWGILASLKVKYGKDNLDILYSDPRYADNSGSSPPVNAEAEDPYTLLPMVVSAGADGLFDLYGLDGVTPPVINYASGGWPNESPSFVSPNSQSPPFPATVVFVDPYMDGVQISQQLGAKVDTNSNGTDESSDNITSNLGF